MNFSGGKSPKVFCLADQKHEMRSFALENRGKIAASIDTTHAAISLSKNFLSYIRPKQNTFIGMYWPFRQEIDVKHLMNKLNFMGCCCLLPAVIGRNEALEFRVWKPQDVLISSRFGTFEPPATHPIGRPEILVAPLLAFDNAGYRLGYGGGYYDRTLGLLRDRDEVFAIGAAYEDQEVDNVPHDGFDQRLDAVVTEKGIREITGK